MARISSRALDGLGQATAIAPLPAESSCPICSWNCLLLMAVVEIAWWYLFDRKKR
jgi:hypothetical protein